MKQKTIDMQIEPVTQKQVDHLIRAIGYLGAMVASLGDVDVSRGRGVLEGNSRCLWTKDGRRITVGISSDGSSIVSCSKEPDPECPAMRHGLKTFAVQRLR